MIVDVLYDGLTVATGADAKSEGSGLFVAMSQPLPVGTRLVLRSTEGEKVARIERVQEGDQPGVLVRYIDASLASASAAPPEPDAPAPTSDEDSGDGSRKGRKRKKTGRMATS